MPEASASICPIVSPSTFCDNCRYRKTICKKGTLMEWDDLRFLRRAIAIAQQARDHGNHPFGALLVDAQQQVILEAENTVVTEQDCTGHAETNLMRLAS